MGGEDSPRRTRKSEEKTGGLTMEDAGDTEEGGERKGRINRIEIEKS